MQQVSLIRDIRVL